MFIILLRFSDKRALASQHIAAHSEWIQRGFDAGVFLAVGSLQPDLGGAIVAHDTTRSDLVARLKEDPFVAADIVTAEILELAKLRTDSRLAFLRS